MSQQLEKNAKLKQELEDLKRIEEALREREELYRAVVDAQTELICRFSSNYTLTFVNTAYCRYFGKKSEELIGRSFMQFIMPEDRQKVEKHLATLSRKNPSASMDYRVIKPNGEIGWQQWIDCAIFDDRGRIKEYQSVGRDITEQVQAEKKLQENERFLQNIFDAIQDGISVLDKDLNIVRVNPTMEKWYPGEVPFEKKKCFQVYHGRKKPCRICPTIRALESCSLEMDIVPWVVSRETVGWLELFSFPLLDPTGRPSGVVEYVRNVTDRVNAEQALRESEQRFRLLADCTYDWENWVAPDGNYVYVSPACERIAGYAPDEFIKDAGLFERIVHPDDRALVSEHLKKVSKSRDIKLIDFRILTRDGEERWINHICQLVYDKDGHYLGIRASNQDITERKRMEEALLIAHEDLEHQVQERTLQLKAATEELKSRQKELLHHKSELEKVNTELLETNKAISVLARNIDKNRQETESTIAKAINSKIMPIVEDLRKAKSLEGLQAALDILAANVQTLTSDLTGGMNLMASLTQTEVRVATMIKNGLTSQEIADKLCISLHTAKTHRRNIRKKLNIINSRINLASYLQSIMW